MTEYLNHRPCDTETPSHKISHDKYFAKWGTINDIKHDPSMQQPRIRRTRITRGLRRSNLGQSSSDFPVLLSGISRYYWCFTLKGGGMYFVPLI